MDGDRPSKRQKVVAAESDKHAESATSSSKDSNGHGFGTQKRKWHKDKSNSSRDRTPHAGGSKYRSTSSTQQSSKGNAKKTKTFSQPSILQTGDKGIFVTCDKGREKQSLLELLDLVEQFVEQHEQEQEQQQQQQQQENEGESSDAVTTTTAAAEQGWQAIREMNDRPAEDDEEQEVDVEASIMEELAALQGRNQQQQQARHNGAPHRDGPSDTSLPLSMPGKEAAGAAGPATTSAGLAVDLITLDVPCVSFLRLPGHSALDPVDLVHHICADAAAHPTRPRSRYVKRLTPVSRLGKVLSCGLESVCADVLPRFFQIPDTDSTTTAGGLKYAIRPSIRNNDKIDRDQIIQTVGECVHTLGKGQHKVDLKGYEAGILVEVYKGWVGVCVVGNGGDGKIVPMVSEMGYERLKRFNLAEIYAAGRTKEGVE